VFLHHPKILVTGLLILFLTQKRKAKNVPITWSKWYRKGVPTSLNFLLSAAVSSADAKEKIPDVTKVREWHFRDLMRLPKAAQEE
jgi:hypothetical protein